MKQGGDLNMGHTSTQISINGNLTIPQHKPDIKSILRVTTTPVIDTIVTMQKKVIFLGHVRICVEYVACAHDGSQPIYFIAFKIPFNGLFCHRNARANLKACLKTKILFEHYDIVDPRTIRKVLTLKLCLHKFIRIKKYTPISCSESGNCDEEVCSSEPQFCCNEPLYPICKEDLPPHPICEDKPCPPGCKDKPHYLDCKKEPLYPICKDDPPQHQNCEDKPHPSGCKDKPHNLGCKNEPLYPVCKVDPPHHSIFGDKPYPSGKDKSHSLGYKSEPLYPAYMESPPHYPIYKDEFYPPGYNNKTPTNSNDDEAVQYGEFHFPQSIQLVYNRESGVP